jgi:hypothetical protein
LNTSVLRLVFTWAKSNVKAKKMHVFARNFQKLCLLAIVAHKCNTIAYALTCILMKENEK